MLRTPWFSGDLKPVRPGVYERMFSTWTGRHDLVQFCYFDGSAWYMHGDTVEQALSRTLLGVTASQSLRWRGVVREIAIKEDSAYGTKNK